MARSPANDVAPKVRGNGVLTLAVAGALLSATGAPVADTLADVIAWGAPEPIARAALYVVPVLGMVAAVLLGRVLGKGRSRGVRWILYAVLGAFAGFLLGRCLDLFAGLPGLIELAVGPLAEPDGVGIVIWAIGALCIALGVMVGLIGVVGQPVVNALQVEETDPECVEVHKNERGVFALSGFGMATLGIACAALAVSRQAGEAERLLPVLVAFVAAVLSVGANYALWRGFDEMQRRHVVNGYSTSAIVVTLGAFAWAGLQALGLAQPVDAAGVFATLVIVQLIATSWVTSSVMGQTSMFGKPA